MRSREDASQSRGIGRKESRYSKGSLEAGWKNREVITRSIDRIWEMEISKWSPTLIRTEASNLANQEFTGDHKHSGKVKTEDCQRVSSAECG